MTLDPTFAHGATSVPHSPVRPAASMGPPFGSPSMRLRQTKAAGYEQNFLEASESQQTMQEDIDACLRRFERWSEARSDRQELEDKYSKLSAYKNRNIGTDCRERLGQLETQRLNAAHELVEQKKRLLEAIEVLFDKFGSKVLSKLAVKNQDTSKDPPQGVLAPAASSTNTYVGRRPSEKGDQSNGKDLHLLNDRDDVDSKSFFQKLSDLLKIEPAEAETRVLSIAKRCLDKESAKAVTMNEDNLSDSGPSSAAKSASPKEQGELTKNEFDVTCAKPLDHTDSALNKLMAEYSTYRQDTEKRLHALEQKALQDNERMSKVEAALEALLGRAHEQYGVVSKQTQLIQDHTDVLQNHIIALARHEEYIESSAKLAIDIQSPLFADAQEHPPFA